MAAGMVSGLVVVGEATLDFDASNAWKAGVSKQMTSGIASLFKTNGVEWVKGTGRFKDMRTPSRTITRKPVQPRFDASLYFARNGRCP